ncbi:MAG TPA: class I SAM-dependent methyltransferase [Trebonia sp.]|jgi:SAM-dependent methyltransferase
MAKSTGESGRGSSGSKPYGTHVEEASWPDESVVRCSFERQAGLFSGANPIFAWSVLSPLEWLEPLSPDWIALDVACGAAHVSEEIAPRVRQVVGVDLTRALLDLAAHRLETAGIENVLLQEGDAGNLPFVNGAFDLVVCRAALHHFPDPAVQVAEMARVCRPGGRVVVSDMVAPSDGDRTSFDALHRVIDPSHARCLTDAEVSELMTTLVGAISSRTEPGLTYTLPIEPILTDVGRPDEALAALNAELTGGPHTGFRPAHTDAGITVTFDRAILASTRGH